LTPAKAQQLAKDMLEPGAAKEQVAKTTADLLDWSHTNRERMSTFVRREIADQLKAIGGVASQAELDALKKRVRDLERAAGMTASGRAKSARSTPAKKRTGAKRATSAAKAKGSAASSG
jgi:polyhydroxyalkanoate synthesis regulator phasin